MLFKDGDRIIFAGDSVTDTGRENALGDGDYGLGNGYVRLVNTFLTAYYPEYRYDLVNMGVSGNNSRQLLERWDRDITALDPDVVFCMIGINDIWRQFDAPAKPYKHVLPDEYEANLDQMAQKSKNVRDFIFLSPFFMEANKEDAMRKMCDEYAAIMRRVAKKNNRPFVDIQAEFDKFLQHRSGIGLSWDRVHPFYIGAMIIARAILREIGFDRPLF